MLGKRALSGLLILVFMVFFPALSLAEKSKENRVDASNIVYDAAGGEVFLEVSGVETNDITYNEEQYKETLKKLKELDQIAKDIDSRNNQRKSKQQGDVSVQGSPSSPVTDCGLTVQSR
jgi:hypothetical protein